MNKRIEWLDQVKGFGIFLVVYGHNLPFLEKYIYSFHMPLFFLVAGIFHPKSQNNTIISKRFKKIVLPYFIWAFLLFCFWLTIGRFYGNSLNYNLSPIKNFIGIFYIQGGMEYMDWGIPLWFLPTIFLSFILLFFINKINHKQLKLITLISLIVIGFISPIYFRFNFPWSFDVALVSLTFYSFGYYFNKRILTLNKNKTILILVLSGLIHFSLFNLNLKIDMYRSTYGNVLLFILNGFGGTLFYIMLFKLIPKFKILEKVGRITIPILALQVRSLSFIKLFLVLTLGVSTFNFNEFEKFSFSIIQIFLIFPIAFLINKYLPILNGGFKKI